MNDKQPLVSIIIPMYNRKELFSSIWNTINDQTHTNLEVIIVDDGSEKPLQIPEYFDKRFSLIRYEINKGPGYARRKGREKTKGKYIAYLDSDDWWSKNFIESCVHILEKNTSLGMVYTDTVMLENNNEVYRRASKQKPNKILPYIFQYKKRSWTTTSCLWKSKVSQSYNWKDLRNNEDIIHDLYSSKINNNVFYNENSLTYKNQSADDRIERDAYEVKECIFQIINIKRLPSYQFTDSFVLRRIYDYNLKFSIKSIYFIFRTLLKSNKPDQLRFYESLSVFILMTVFGLRKNRFKKLWDN